MELSYQGTFVPRNESSMGGTFVPWNFCSQEPSFRGTFVPKSEIYMELLFPNSKIISDVTVSYWLRSVGFGSVLT